ncbi:MAG: flagellar biosynthesis anti-sigma factor FlgM [Rhodocyclales bacterium]|nr:flagellar biosynthesis anti-sigma factor FlgM [Rhodocyclales bacterium]
MKINSAIGSVGKVGGDGPSAAAPSRTAGVPQGSPKEQVDISAFSARLQEIGASVASSPAFNAERVAEIKQAIAEGRFKINPERIADGLLDNVRQMLAKHR